MQKLFEILKSRIEPYIGIGVVIVMETDTLMMKKEGRWYWWDPD